jgi:hypothetical protein
VLARQYAYENRERYAGVWSFAAETRPGVTEGLIELGARFIPNLDQVENKQAAARHTLEFIADPGFAKPWLLIYDNIETPKTLDGLMPRSGAHILITTRWHNWQGRASPLELGKFSEDEAVAFLLTYTQRTDRDGAARLAEALGYLPLALDHAAAFCFEGGLSFDAYRAQLADWLDDAPEGADYPQAVFATFNLAIEKATAAEPMAEKLMGHGNPAQSRKRGGRGGAGCPGDRRGCVSEPCRRRPQLARLRAASAPRGSAPARCAGQRRRHGEDQPALQSTRNLRRKPRRLRGVRAIEAPRPRHRRGRLRTRPSQGGHPPQQSGDAAS